MKKLFLILLIISSSVKGQYLNHINLIKSNGTDGVTATTIDSEGKFLASGHFTDTHTFPGDVASEVFFPIGEFDMFISKYDNGEFIWAKTIGGTHNVISTDIIVDQDDNIFITGYFTTGSYDFDPGAGTTILTGTGTFNSFILKLDTDGNFLWARKGESTSSAISYSCVMDNAGNSYWINNFQETISFICGEETTDIVSEGSYDGVIVKLDADGNCLWTKQIGGNGNDQIRNIGMDNTGNLYLTGHFSQTVDFDFSADEYSITAVGLIDIYVLKLDVEGNFIWVKSAGGTSVEAPRGMCLDLSGNVFITGFWEGTTDFNSGADVDALIASGNRDIFVYKLNPEGEFIWVRGVGSAIGDDFSRGMALDKDANIYVGGEFTGSVSFNPVYESMIVTSNGLTDGFVWKLDAMGNSIFAFGIGAETDDTVYDVEVTEDGDFYASGYYSRVVDFEPLSGVVTFSSNLNGFDGYICKYSVNPLDIGIKDNEVENLVLAYPNPFTDFTTIKFGDNLLNGHTIVIHDLLGQEVYRNENIIGSEIQIRKEQLGAGVFILSLYNSNTENICTIKLSVQ